jgi:hypothetical protein
MAEAEHVERQLDRARLAVLKARACWAEWVAPPPEFEVTIPDEEYARRREVDLIAKKAEDALWEALELVRVRFLGWPEGGPSGTEVPGDE